MQSFKKIRAWAQMKVPLYFCLLPAETKCEVACQAQVYRFVTGFGRPVRDGIPCDEEETSRICLHGKCKVSATQPLP